MMDTDKVAEIIGQKRHYAKMENKHKWIDEVSLELADLLEKEDKERAEINQGCRDKPTYNFNPKQFKKKCGVE